MVALPRQLFSGLLDDAAVFPPRNAPVASSVAEHLTWLTTSSRDFFGPLLCPASRIEELSSVLPPTGHLCVSLVADGDALLVCEAIEAVHDDRRLILVAVEAAHARLGPATAELGEMVAELPGVTGALEVPQVDFEESLALVDAGLWDIAKYRTGGTSEDAFPTEGELATFLLACAVNGLAFKLTAGLHHVARNHDSRTGFQQHGVLNVLLATDAALRDEEADVVVSLLAQRNIDGLIGRLRRWDTDRAEIVRETFRSFGCCDPADPIRELKELGLIEEWP